MKFVLFGLFSLSNFLWICKTVSIHEESEKVLLISFDGFLHSYLHQVKQKRGWGFTPNFDYLIKEGTFVEGGLLGSYATVTIPSHWTIATGMYQESHGVVGRQMYDPRINETLTITADSSKSSFWFNNGTSGGGGEPIWVTNERQGGLSGVMHWIGLDVELHGFLPTRQEKFNIDMATGHKETIDKLINWLIDENPINLGLLYISQPDKFGHFYGPTSIEVLNEIIRLDDIVGYLIERLKEEDLYDSINLIITSDHGMTDSSKEKLIVLEDYLDSMKYVSINNSPIIHITPLEGVEADEIIKNLSSVKHIKVWKKEDIPSEFHYKFNERIMPILLTADLNWNIVKTRREYNKWFHLGSHGYYNNISSMHPIFIGRGPAFKNNYKADQFESVDIYPLICQLLGLTPFPNNGSFQRVANIIKDERLKRLGVFGSVQLIVGQLRSFIIIFIILVPYAIYKMYKTKPYYSRF